MSDELDIYICHNNRNFDTLRPFVEKLGRYGFQAHVAAFENGSPRSMKAIQARMIIVAIGDDGAGAWELPQLAADLEAQSNRGVRVAIVLLPGAPDELSLPAFLKHAEVIDLRREDDQVNWNRFILNMLEILKVLETSRAILTSSMKAPAAPSRNQAMDAVGIAAVKSQLHALSEIVAKDASEEAVQAAKTYPYDVLTMLVPLFVDLRWRRGYRVALERLLKLPEPQKFLRHFKCEETDPPCNVEQGVVSAEIEGKDTVLILLANHPAARITELTEQDASSIAEAVNNFGRLPRGKTGELSVIERIRDLPVRGLSAWKDDLAQALYRNREVLIPLIARYRIPQAEWLLADDEALPDTRRELPKWTTPELREKQQPAVQDVTTFDAEAAFREKDIFRGEDITELLHIIRGWKR